MDSTTYMRTAEPATDLLGGVFGIGYLLVCLAVCVFIIAAFWKLYAKAGVPGWHSIIPFLCNWDLSKMTFGSIVPFVLTLVPFVNICALYAMFFKTAIVFGKGVGFGILTVFFPYICIPILAFGSAEYVGPNNNYNQDYGQEYYQ